MAVGANHWPKHCPATVRADRYHHDGLKILVADAFVVETVSTPKFPANREKKREFCRTRLLGTYLKANTRAHSEACREIPH